MNNLKQTIVLFLVILIFGSGLAIYVWNLIHGKNLAEPPQFDLSAYDDMSTFDEIRENLFNTEIPEEVPPEVVIEEVASADLLESETIQSQSENENYLYFKNSFKLGTVSETNALIVSFLSDFPGFQDAKIDNLEALKNVKVELPALNREEIIESLEKNEQIEKVAVIEPPIWELTLVPGLYQEALVDLLSAYNGVLIKTDFPESGEYIARIDLSELQTEESVLDKMETEYSDVVTFVKP